MVPLPGCCQEGGRILFLYLDAVRRQVGLKFLYLDAVRKKVEYGSSTWMLSGGR
jgi:hypothetical protein